MSTVPAIAAWLVLFVMLLPALLRADDLVRVSLKDDPGALKIVLSTGYRTILHRRGKFIDVVVPHRKLGRLKRLCSCVVLQSNLDRYVKSISHRADRGVYHTFDEMRKRMMKWCKIRHGTVTIETIGNGWKTIQGAVDHPILMATIGRPRMGVPAILLLGGIHAREIATTEVILRVTEELLTRAKHDRQLKQQLDRLVIYVVPLLNPDGRELVFSGDIWWRKNCRPGPDDSTIGVDLNRNFSFHFGANKPFGGSSSRPRSETYRGPYAFSEPESRALQRAVLDRPDIVASLAFHSYGRLLLMPSGFNGRLPDDASELYRTIARELTLGTSLESGTVRELLGYYSNGRHDDWLFGSREQGKQAVLAFQLELGDTFFPPAAQLDELSKEVFLVLKRLIRRVTRHLSFTLRRLGGSSLELTVTNEGLDRIIITDLVLEDPGGHRHQVCSGTVLSGRLRGPPPTKLTRIIRVQPKAVAGAFKLMARWTGGSTEQVLVLAPSPVTGTSAED